MTGKQMFDPAVEGGIAIHLDAVRRAMGANASELVLEEVENSIRSRLGERVKTPTIRDLAGVLAEMDAPSAYAGEESLPSRPARPIGPPTVEPVRNRRFLHLCSAALFFVALVRLAYPSPETQTEPFFSYYHNIGRGLDFGVVDRVRIIGVFLFFSFCISVGRSLFAVRSERRTPMMLLFDCIGCGLCGIIISYHYLQILSLGLGHPEIRRFGFQGTGHVEIPRLSLGISFALAALGLALSQWLANDRYRRARNRQRG